MWRLAWWRMVFFDCAHGSFTENAGVPGWWPGFCLAIDLALGMWLIVVVLKRSNQELQFVPGLAALHRQSCRRFDLPGMPMNNGVIHHEA